MAKIKNQLVKKHHPRRKQNKSRAEKVGLPPGTLVHLGGDKQETVKITVFDYNPDHYEEKWIASIDELSVYKDSDSVTWINVDGIHQVELIEQLGKRFDIHPLIQEDIVNPSQRPKIEYFGNFIFIVLRMLDYDNEQKRITEEQVSLILGHNFVMSIQEEEETDVFDPIRERIRNNKVLIRSGGADYLLYTLLDMIVDHYFIVLDALEDQIDQLEADLIAHPQHEHLQHINNLKNEVIHIRKITRPLREVLIKLEKLDTELFSDAVKVYIRDIQDHIISIIETIESFREMLSGKFDIYLSSVSNKMNTIMTTLTIISSIFIPLTFLAGVYGMNFKHMPELEWQWSYPLFWIVNIILVSSLLLFFRRKQWL